MYTPSKERAKVIRTALNKNLKADKISVTIGKGTARSWVHADIDIVPLNCACEQYRAEHQFGYCQNCRARINETSAEVRKIADEALKAHNMEHGTFTSDDGYNTEHDEFLVQVSVIN